MLSLRDKMNMILSLHKLVVQWETAIKQELCIYPWHKCNCGKCYQKKRERGALRVNHMEPPLSWNKEKKLPEEIFWLGLEGSVGVY